MVLHHEMSLFLSQTLQQFHGKIGWQNLFWHLNMHRHKDDIYFPREAEVLTKFYHLPLLSKGPSMHGSPVLLMEVNNELYN